MAGSRSISLGEGSRLRGVRLDFAELREELRHQFDRLRAAVIGFLTKRDPFLEFAALSGGGFQLSARNQQHSVRRIFVHGHRFAAIIPGDSAAELVLSNGLSNFLNLYNLCLVGRLILTWFPTRPEVIEGPLSTLCDPYLNLFRGLLPPLGNIDFSPILAFVILNVFSSTAAALPAELGENKQYKPTREYKPWEVHRQAADNAAERKKLKEKLRARKYEK